MNTRQQTLNNIEVMGEPSMGGVDSRANAGGGGRSLTQQDLSAIASLINIGVKQQQIANKDVKDAAQGRHPLNRNWQSDSDLPSHQLMREEQPAVIL